jgi:hypothetical protein
MNPNDALLIAELQETGLVDTHFHVGPEFLDRRYNLHSLAEAARSSNMTLVLKNHTYSTTPLAALARATFGVRFLGSVVLNRFVGGLNPDAILGAQSGNRANVNGESDDPPFVVYLPTVHAASHLRVLGYAFDKRWSCGHAIDYPADRAGEPVRVFDENLKPVPALEEVLQAIVETGAILATGHLAAAEIMELVPMALDLGVRRVLLTHPHYPSVELSDEQLVHLSRDNRVFIEHCFAIHTIEEVPLARFADSILATGPDQVILATDFGQIHSDPVPDGTLRFARELSAIVGNRLAHRDLVRMFTTNGARALDLQAEGQERELESGTTARAEDRLIDVTNRYPQITPITQIFRPPP